MLIINRKSHTCCFRLAPKSVIFGDFERPLGTSLHFTRVFGSHHEFDYSEVQFSRCFPIDVWREKVY